MALSKARKDFFYAFVSNNSKSKATYFFFSSFLSTVIAVPQGGLIASHVCETVGRESLTFSKEDRLLLSENREKEFFKLGSMHFIFPRNGSYIASSTLVI